MISADFHGTSLARTVSNLADLIEHLGGLPRDHVRIRMLACWGHGFAKHLACELGRRRYDRIRVAGYVGQTVPGAYERGTGRGGTPVLIDGENNYDKARVVWYDGSGAIVPKPDADPRAVVGQSNSEWD